MNSPVFKRSGETIFSPVGADIVALHIPNGRCYGMEEVSAAVWNLLAEPRDIGSLCEQLMQRYDVDLATCRSDVEKLIDLFRSEGLVELAGDGRPNE